MDLISIILLDLLMFSIDAKAEFKKDKSIPDLFEGVGTETKMKSELFTVSSKLSFFLDSSISYD